MIAERIPPFLPRRSYPLDAALLALAASDDRGVPLAGRAAELVALRRAGARDASAGRIFEGHLNGAQLVARCGTVAQRAAARADLAAGRLFGVWNTQDDAERLRVEPQADALVLRGGKTWASGAGTIERPVVTAAWPDGTVRMIVLRMDEIAAHIDPAAWQPLGMHDSDSFRVSLDGVVIAAGDVLGEPGEYERQPWFFAGALRFAAVHTGVMERLYAATVDYLRERGRAGDVLQTTRVAEMKIAVHTAELWIERGAAAWSTFDANPSDATAADVLDAVDMARTVVERAALDVIERAVRSVGAKGLVEPEPFPRLVRDLQMYLRQPAPDAALLRVGRAAFGGAR